LDSCHTNGPKLASVAARALPINDDRANESPSKRPCPQRASDIDGHGLVSLRLPTLMIPRLEQKGQPCGLGAQGAVQRVHQTPPVKFVRELRRDGQSMPV
jgi:hypothetical protein